MQAQRTVIVGAGHAGGQCAISLRQAKYEGDIVLIGQEAHLPYERPPLSKQALVAGPENVKLLLRKADYYATHHIELKTGCEVTRLQLEQQQVQLSTGETLDFSHLVLATGGRVRRLAVPGAELQGIHYLRTIADTQAIRAEVRPGMRVVIVGGGYIGLEAAASLRKLECEVVVLEALDRLMSRSVGTELSGYFREYHEKNGVEIHTGMQVIAFNGSERVEEVSCLNGMQFPADMVIVGIGIEPATSLAEAAGLEVAGGIVVDAHCRSSHPQVFAIGDVALAPNKYASRPVRLESVQNAVGQARVAAQNIAGKAVLYEEVPWFWSDQYDLKLQMAGLHQEASSHVVRGNPAEGAFALWYFKNDKVQAVHALNSPRDFMFGKQLIASGKEVDPARVGNSEVSLKEIRDQA